MGLGRNVVKWGLVRLSRLMSLSLLKGMVGRDVYVVNYHSIARVDVDPYINRNLYRTSAEFEDDVKYYKGHFNVLNAVDLLDILSSGKKVTKDALVITFDDGLAINYEYQYPILKKHNVTATFFLCSAFVGNRDMHYGRKANLLRQTMAQRGEDLNQRVQEYLVEHGIFKGNVDRSLSAIGYHSRFHLEEIARMVGVDFHAFLAERRPYLDDNQVREMISCGFTFGAHSVDHPNYAELSQAEQVDQTLKSMQHIVDRFDLDYRLFAFPYGDESLTPGFFKEIEPHVDLTFGMQGFVDSDVSFNLQRGDIESTGLPVDHAFRYRLLLASMHGIRTSRDRKEERLIPAL